MNHEYYMGLAVKEAELALKEGNWPIGCVLELNDAIISKAHNQVYTSKNKLAHAEMLALQKIQNLTKEDLRKVTLYTTYEPCPMCFGAIILSKIKQVVTGINLDNSGSMYLRDNLPLLFKQNKFDVNFVRGVLADKCEEVFMKSDLAKKLNKNGLLNRIN